MLLGAPATALAGSPTGGAAAPSGGLVPPASLLGGPPPSAAAAEGPPGPGTLESLPGGAMLGTVELVRGRLTRAEAGRPVVLAILEAGRGWVNLGAARADAVGGFVVAWRPRHPGRFLLRASAPGTSVRPIAPVEVYLPVVATWFGPGSYGSRTACGEILTPDLVGVAHRSLPCGTMVDIVYGNQALSVPVVDRGPFTSGVSYDLTAATAQALGVSETVHIGAVPVRGAAPPG
ncbi:MAG: septal ring lytic transglycosylase RlpA family protein [Actinobacteria bacterium]|nr:septal ring lytic transglycosylase RlpA family protein [Actinomycetota bacterium]